jgi:hypothetical protein
MNTGGAITAVKLRKETKNRLDRWRAPGQGYDDFLSQMLDIWEKMRVSPHRH